MSRVLRPAAFLDRDGVINVDHGYTYRPEDLTFVDGAPAAIRRLNEAGYLVVVVTNQSGVARGYYGEADVARFHAHMQRELAKVGARIDAFYACPYHAEGTVAAYRVDHPDRKPKPGMILRALHQLPIDRERSFLIGDQPSDMAAAASADIAGYPFSGGDLDDFLVTVLLQENAA
ncbi:D,D-heptose 1,7-bisphosphate phosphatase [Kaistia sp. 32K]|uniref:D-glycero-alpha-D-manno-heptose-1,7-bisphosphate 7-phosphatase n=1 Tax=Kaistia sp. 32K TaxID=2795690 RepID=UPI001915DC7A|nr:HAD family hydrolase [Kaistia sp. 32K]BCP53392.1 D,D-heptose 1,7-bisphosphate phosphatase [Kaistia sp. 32K]